MDEEKAFCPRCKSKKNVVDYITFFRCAYCETVILKKGQLTLEKYI